MEQILDKYDYHQQTKSSYQMGVIIHELLSQRINQLPEFPRMAFKKRLQILSGNHNVQQLSDEWFGYLNACQQEGICAFCGFAIEEPVSTFFCSEEHFLNWKEVLETLDQVYLKRRPSCLS